MQMRISCVVILAGSLLPCSFSIAQSKQSIVGRVVDSHTNNAIPFANIRLKNKNTGVVSNIEGDFQIPYHLKSASDSIVISCIGYSKKAIAMDDLGDTIINIVALNESDYQLNEVVFFEKKKRKKLASAIVQRAIDNITTNCPATPFGYVAYYRDYQTIKKRYINLNEAIVEIYDQGFNSSDFSTTSILLYEYRKNKEFRQDTTAARPYDNDIYKYVPHANLFSFGGNELSILRVHDAIRNFNAQSYSYINILQKDFIKNHYFKYEKPVYSDTTLLYCISFVSKFAASGPLHTARGKIYIEDGNYAIYKIEYSNYFKEKGVENLLYDIQLEYSKLNDKMYLNYISFNNIFKTKYVVDDKLGYWENYVQVHQYRELFVQKVNVTGNQVEGISIDKTKPLSKNEIDKKSDLKSLFWMNTPLKKN